MMGAIARRWQLFLRGARAGYALDFLGLALLGALMYRYRVGYVPGLLYICLPGAAAVVALSAAGLLMQRTPGSIFRFLVPTAIAGFALFLALMLAGLIPPVTTAVYKQRARATAETLIHSLPGDLDLFLDGYDKTSLRSFDDFAKQGAHYAERWRGNLVRQGFSAEEAKAVGLMLFTSTLWAYGNAEHPNELGCITVNEQNDWKPQQPTFEVVKKASIGCCNDYAYTLSLVLSKNGFENRYVALPGHIFNEAIIDGNWRVLDANTNVFIDHSWNQAVDAAKVKIHMFPHPGGMGGKLHRALLDDFQNYELNMLLLGGASRGELRPGRPVDPTYAMPIEALY